jgi:creatinine amidohydrolase/Fe(II)-dependent formamide hydrolase-like protein
MSFGVMIIAYAQRHPSTIDLKEASSSAFHRNLRDSLANIGIRNNVYSNPENGPSLCLPLITRAFSGNFGSINVSHYSVERNRI